MVQYAINADWIATPKNKDLPALGKKPKPTRIKPISGKQTLINNPRRNADPQLVGLEATVLREGVAFSMGRNGDAGFGGAGCAATWRTAEEVSLLVGLTMRYGIGSRVAGGLGG